MFATLFLGVVLAVFLTLGAIRGDAERGLLQPLLVRPISRRDVLLGRAAGRRRRSARLRARRLPRRLVHHRRRSAAGGRTASSRPRSRSPLARRRHHRAVAGRLGRARAPPPTASPSSWLFGSGLDRRPAGPDRRRPELRHAPGRRRRRRLRAAVRGALPGRPRPADRRHRRASPASPSSSARSAAPSRPAPACGLWPLAYLVGRDRARRSAAFRAARPLVEPEAVLDGQAGPRWPPGIVEARPALDAELLGELARLEHLGRRCRSRRPARPCGRAAGWSASWRWPTAPGGCAGRAGCRRPRTGVPSDSRIATVRAEKPQRRRSGVPFMKRIDLVLGDRLCDRGADRVVVVMSALLGVVLRDSAWIRSPSSAPKIL